MTSFDSIRRYLATTASKPCFTLYVIHLVVRRLFSMFLVLMYSPSHMPTLGINIRVAALPLRQPDNIK